MTFDAASFGAAGNLVPFGLISNIIGEQAVGYDASGNLIFQRASGSTYTPERVDTLVINAGDGVLGALLAGPPVAANDDVGTLTTADPTGSLTNHGLAANFGPGRGNWTSEYAFRLRGSASIFQMAVAVPATAAGSVQSFTVVGGGNAEILFRNFSAEDAATLRLVVECVHTVQD